MGFIIKTKNKRGDALPNQKINTIEDRSIWIYLKRLASNLRRECREDEFPLFWEVIQQNDNLSGTVIARGIVDDRGKIC